MRLGIGVCVLDAGMVNVALPDIARALSVTPADAIWIVNAFGLVIAITLLPFASFAERIGFKRVFALGLFLFIFGGVVSALSAGFGALLVGRVVQGLGASAIMCMSGALTRHIYPSALLSRGIALNAMLVSVASVIGPTIGSLLLTLADWRWIFVAVAPLVLFAWISTRSLPDIARISLGFDYLSAFLSAIAIALLILGLNYLGAHTFYALLLFAAGVILATLLVRWSAAQTSPLVPIDLLKIGAIRAAAAASGATFAMQTATFVALPFYLQITFGRDPLAVGFLLAGWPIGAAIMALVAARLTERYPVAILCALGAVAMTAGPLILMLLPPTVNDGWLLLAMVISGIGFGFFQTPNNRALLGSAPRERAGAVGALQAVMRVFGQTVGAAIVATAFTLSPTDNPIWGLVVACFFGLVALVINVHRHLKTQGAQV